MKKIDKIKLWIFVILRLSIIIAGLLSFFEKKLDMLGIVNPYTYCYVIAIYF
jgi:hypothetical protein